MSQAHEVIHTGVLTDADRQVLEEALAALLRERSNALRIAVKIANAAGERIPSVGDFGLPDILRLSRALLRREL
ncbi:hypothetical protein SB861_29740 [Paraburkholderia sp. SIMBA_049]